MFGGSDRVMLGCATASPSVLNQVQNAMTSGMLGIGGFVAFRILLKRRGARRRSPRCCASCWVVLSAACSSPGCPPLDLMLGCLIITTGSSLVDRLGRPARDDRGAGHALHPAARAADDRHSRAGGRRPRWSCSAPCSRRTRRAAIATGDSPHGSRKSLHHMPPAHPATRAFPRAHRSVRAVRHRRRGPMT